MKQGSKRSSYSPSLASGKQKDLSGVLSLAVTVSLFPPSSNLVVLQDKRHLLGCRVRLHMTVLIAVNDHRLLNRSAH